MIARRSNEDARGMVWQINVIGETKTRRLRAGFHRRQQHATHRNSRTPIARQQYTRAGQHPELRSSANADGTRTSQQNLTT
jgi:hypothetical protein